MAKLIMLVLVAGLLAGCGTTQGLPTAVSGACLVWKPVTSSTKDTEQTRREVVANNAAWQAYCGENP